MNLIDETLKKFRENIENKIPVVSGALGELPNCSAYEEYTDKKGMWITKYVGINHTFFKGITDNAIIDKVTITKRAFREIIRMWPLRFNKLLDSFYQIYACEGGLKSVCLKLENFCTFCQEIIKAGKEQDLVYCLAMFLQFSTGYRFRVQDILGEIDKENFIKYPVDEIHRLRKICLSREKAVIWAIPLLFRLLIFAMIIPKYRKMAIEFVKELNVDRAKLDSSDYYFCLRRTSYDFLGKTLEERLKEAEIVDKEYSNILLGK